MEIRWFRGNDFLALPEKCNVSTDRSSEITISTLEIRSPTVVDVGEYSCYVELRDTNKAIRVSAELRISGMYIVHLISIMQAQVLCLICHSKPHLRAEGVHIRQTVSACLTTVM